MLKPTNIQLFAEGGESTSDSEPVFAGKTFPEAYVRSLRREAASYRNTAKAYERALRSLLGLEEAGKPAV